MTRFIAWSTVVAVFTVVSLSTPAWAIRGGTAADDSALVASGYQNWMRGMAQLIAVHDNQARYACSGAVIGPDLILTSAHCFDTGHNRWQVVVAGRRYGVESVGIHKHYRREEVFDAYWNYLLEIRLHNDLALVRIQQTLDPEGRHILALRDLGMAHANPPADETKYYMVGYGQTEHLFGIGEGEGQLRVAGPVDYPAQITPRMQFKNRPEGACLGDSGAPLLTHGAQTLVIAAVLSQSDCLGNSTYQRVTQSDLAPALYRWGALKKQIAHVIKE